MRKKLPRLQPGDSLDQHTVQPRLCSPHLRSIYFDNDAYCFYVVDNCQSRTVEAVFDYETQAEQYIIEQRYPEGIPSRREAKRQGQTA